MRRSVYVRLRDCYTYSTYPPPLSRYPQHVVDNYQSAVEKPHIYGPKGVGTVSASAQAERPKRRSRTETSRRWCEYTTNQAQGKIGAPPATAVKSERKTLAPLDFGGLCPRAEMESDALVATKPSTAPTSNYATHKTQTQTHHVASNSNTIGLFPAPDW